MLDELSQTARSVTEATAGSVVRLGRGRRGASAIVISEDRLLTNAHSVYDDVMSVRTIDGRVIEASVAGVDVDGDIAVLRAKDIGPAVGLSEEPVSIGSPVFAVGVSRAGARVTFGLVSSVGGGFRGPGGRRISGSIEHTAPLAHGSSGSALVDAGGHLVGINTSRLGNGFYVALPTDQALQARVERLATGERIERPRLGIAVAPSWVAQRMRRAVGLDAIDGLLVREVEPESPAAEAGIAVGDLLVGIGERPILEPDDLADAIDAGPDTLDVRLVRGETGLTIVVRIRP